MKPGAPEQLVLTLISPLYFLRDRGYRIERVPEDFGWWSLTPPDGSFRKGRLRCRASAVLEIAVSEGWAMRDRQPKTQKAADTRESTAADE